MNAFKIREQMKAYMSVKPLLVFCFMVAVSSWGQTAGDLAAKYHSVSAYEVRPGVLMTAKYADDGQVCEMVLEVRHYHSPENIDLDSVIPGKLETRLVDELVPASERGEPKNRWLNNREPKDGWVDPDSYSAGGVSYIKRSYENVSIEEHGYYRCHEAPSSKEKVDCGEGGNEVVVIRWTKRTCSGPKAKTSDSTKANNRTDTAADTKSPAEVIAQRSELGAKMSQDTDTVDPATGNLRMTIPVVATTKPSR
jgi:hypothetical protein